MEKQNFLIIGKKEVKNDRPMTQTCFWQNHRKRPQNKEVHIHIDARCTLNPKEKRSKNTPQYIIVKTLHIQNKGKILKTAEDKNHKS